MEDQERSPEELPPEAVQKLEVTADAAIERLRDQFTGRGLQFPPFNLGKTWHGPQEALDKFNAAVDELADTYPDITDGYTTVRGNQLRIVDYRPRQFDGGRRRESVFAKRPREDYQDSQQAQQERRY